MNEEDTQLKGEHRHQWEIYTRGKLRDKNMKIQGGMHVRLQGRETLSRYDKTKEQCVPQGVLEKNDRNFNGAKAK